MCIIETSLESIVIHKENVDVVYKDYVRFVLKKMLYDKKRPTFIMTLIDLKSVSNDAQNNISDTR